MKQALHRGLRPTDQQVMLRTSVQRVEEHLFQAIKAAFLSSISLVQALEHVDGLSTISQEISAIRSKGWVAFDTQGDVAEDHQTCQSLPGCKK